MSRDTCEGFSFPSEHHGQVIKWDHFQLCRHSDCHSASALLLQQRQPWVVCDAGPPGLQGWCQEGHRGETAGACRLWVRWAPRSTARPHISGPHGSGRFQQTPRGLSSLPVGPVSLATLKIKEPKDLQSENPDLFSEVDSSKNIK